MAYSKGSLAELNPGMLPLCGMHHNHSAPAILNLDQYIRNPYC